LDFEIDLKFKEPPFQFEVDFKVPEVEKFVVDEPPDTGAKVRGQMHHAFLHRQQDSV
jgi:hypothetical protein